MLRPPPTTLVAAPIVATPVLRRSAPAKQTTAFVSGIPPEVPDRAVEELLNLLGRVRSWKRVVDPAGAPKAFGFCEFEDAESVLRALRLLPKLPLHGKALLVRTLLPPGRLLPRGGG